MRLSISFFLIRIGGVLILVQGLEFRCDRKIIEQAFHKESLERQSAGDQIAARLHPDFIRRCDCAIARGSTAICSLTMGDDKLALVLQLFQGIAILLGAGGADAKFAAANVDPFDLVI